MICKRYTVTGRVQGVFYRASTRRRAERLGLTGDAHNLPDGRVEVLACGEEARIVELAAWLWQGPEHAQVEGVIEEQAVHDVHPMAFTTG